LTKLLSRVGRGNWPNDAAATDRNTIAKWGVNEWTPLRHGAKSNRREKRLRDKRCEGKVLQASFLLKRGFSYFVLNQSRKRKASTKFK